MRGILSLTVAVAAAFGLTAGATAAPVPTYIQIDSSFLCDVFGITARLDPVLGGKIDLAVNETDPNGTCETFIGQGVAGKVGTMKAASFSGVFTSIQGGPGDPRTVFTYVVTYPLVTGGQWILYYTTDGQKMNYLLNGTYTVLSSAPSKSKSGKRVTSVLHK